MDNFLTQTCTHKNNPTGAASLSTVATGIACSPLDPTSTAPNQDYPTEKLYLLRETYTEYAAFETGDFITVGSETFAIKAVLPWLEQGGLDTFYRLIVEKQLSG